MTALEKTLGLFGFVSNRAESTKQRDIGGRHDGTRPINGAEKPKGLFAQLSEDQKARVLTHEGPVATGRSDLPPVSKG